MSAQFARLPAAAADQRPQRRKVSRSPAEVNALLSAQGREVEVRLADVSTHGCNVRGDVAWLRCGAFIAIGFGEERPLPAIVRWQRDDALGMEFLRPVPLERRDWHQLIDSPLGA